MTQYTSVFGGANIYPSDISYSALALTADVTLHWPEETNAAEPYATRIIDVSAASAFDIFLPDARAVSPGETILFNNTGAAAVLVKDAGGTQLLSLAAGTTWQVYLTDNTTEDGTWRVFQYGAAVSAVNAASLAGTGIVAIGSLLSQSIPVSSFNSNYAAGVNDRARMYTWTGAGGTLELPAPPTVGDNWFLLVRNAGSGALVLDPAGGALIDGAASKSYQPGESSIVVTDGTAYYSVGYGQSAIFAFDHTSVGVGGAAGDYTLSGAELNRISYRFTGVLTGNRNVIVPATVQQYWVDNSTTGAFNFVVKTAAGTGVTVGTGTRAILYCDGTNVINASTGGIAVPIAVADGGTGATTPSAARTNLGATSVGNALFTAADQAAAYAALGAVPESALPTVNGGAF